MRAIEKRLQRIEIEGQQLRRRKDGLFHAGSALGAKLNTEISELAPERSDCQAICHELFQLPVERLRQWSALLGRLLGFRWAISIYIGCLAYGVTLAPSSAVALHGVILRNLGEYLPALSFPLYGAMALSSIVAVCAGGAAYLFYNSLFYNHYAAQFERHQQACPVLKFSTAACSVSSGVDSSCCDWCRLARRREWPVFRHSCRILSLNKVLVKCLQSSSMFVLQACSSISDVIISSTPDIVCQRTFEANFINSRPSGSLI